MLEEREGERNRRIWKYIDYGYAHHRYKLREQLLINDIRSISRERRREKSIFEAVNKIICSKGR